MPISSLSLGSWLTFGNQISDSTAEKLMKTAYDQGVNFFDNAEQYAGGRSEKVMGKILKKMRWSRDSFCVSSKVFFGYGDLPTQKGLNRKHVSEACEQAMKRLNVEYLDLFFCHRADPQTPIEETVWTMTNLVKQGKIFYWGTSEWTAEEIIKAHTVAERHHLIAPAMEQPQYNLLLRDRMEREYAVLFARYGTGTTIYSPLSSGMLTGKYIQKFPKNTRLSVKGNEWLKERKMNDVIAHEKVKKLKAVADELGTSLTLMSLAWCLKNPHVSTVILGASRVEQLKENLKAIDIVTMLSDEVMRQIEQCVA